MKTWAEVHASPEFHTAPADVKAEIRGHYKRTIAAHPVFQTLDPEEQARVLRAVDGDGDFPIRMAASLIAAAQKERLGRAILEPTVNPALDEALKGAKAAEQHLDVPLKDRPREPFQDEIPGHLDRPLRALLGFIDDALPEYVAYKFWQTYAGQPLEERLRNVLTISAQAAPRPVDANAALNLAGFIRSYPDLDRRLPTRLPALSLWPAEAREKVLTTDAEAALKHGLPLVAWAATDRAVQTILVHVLAGVKAGVPHAFRPDAVTAIAAAVKQRAYELLARAYYRLPSPAGGIPLDPEVVGEMVLAAPVLAPGMERVAGDFPALFAVAAGLAAVPRAAQGRYATFVQNEVRAPLTPEMLLRVVTTGAFSLIKLSAINEVLYETAATAAGARAEHQAALRRDATTAAQQPLLAALLTRSAALDTQAFKTAQAAVRGKVQEEARRQLAAVPPRPAAPAAPEEPDAIHVLHDGAAPALPAALAYADPDPEPAPAPSARPEAPASPPAPADPNPGDGGPVHAYLRAHPLDRQDVRRRGLTRDLAPFPDVVAEAGGTTLDVAAAALVTQGLLPAGADANDLLDALERELRGVSAPPPGAEAGDHLPPAAPPASPSEPKNTEIKSPEMSPAAPVEKPKEKSGKKSAKLSPGEVRVVEVDPHTLIFRKDEERLWNSRATETRKRFPEGAPLATIAAYETKRGLEIIDGDHRAAVAKERGETLKAAVIAEAVYRRLEGAGLTREQIVHAVLTAAGEALSAGHIAAQYPETDFRKETA